MSDFIPGSHSSHLGYHTVHGVVFFFSWCRCSSACRGLCCESEGFWFESCHKAPFSRVSYLFLLFQVVPDSFRSSHPKSWSIFPLMHSQTNIWSMLLLALHQLFTRSLWHFGWYFWSFMTWRADKRRINRQDLLAGLDLVVISVLWI